MRISINFFISLEKGENRHLRSNVFATLLHPDVPLRSLLSHTHSLLSGMPSLLKARSCLQAQVCFCLLPSCLMTHPWGALQPLECLTQNTFSPGLEFISLCHVYSISPAWASALGARGFVSQLLVVLTAGILVDKFREWPSYFKSSHWYQILPYVRMV